MISFTFPSSACTLRPFSGPSPPCRATPQPSQALLDILSVENLVSMYLGQGVPPSTQNSYSSAKRRDTLFCSSLSIPPSLVTAKSNHVAAFLAQSGLQGSSIALYLSALRQLSVEVTLPLPQANKWPILQYFLHGIILSELNPHLAHATC